MTVFLAARSICEHYLGRWSRIHCRALFRCVPYRRSHRTRFASCLEVPKTTKPILFADDVGEARRQDLWKRIVPYGLHDVIEAKPRNQVAGAGDAHGAHQRECLYPNVSHHMPEYAWRDCRAGW